MFEDYFQGAMAECFFRLSRENFLAYLLRFHRIEFHEGIMPRLYHSMQIPLGEEEVEEALDILTVIPMSNLPRQIDVTVQNVRKAMEAIFRFRRRMDLRIALGRLSTRPRANLREQVADAIAMFLRLASSEVRDADAVLMAFRHRGAYQESIGGGLEAPVEETFGFLGLQSEELAERLCKKASLDARWGQGPIAWDAGKVRLLQSLLRQFTWERTLLDLEGEDAGGESANQANNRGNNLAQRGLYREAELCYRQGIESDPVNHIVRFNYGNLLLRQGRYEEGILYLEQSLEMDPVPYGCLKLDAALSILRAALTRHDEATTRQWKDWIDAALNEFGRDRVHILWDDERLYPHISRRVESGRRRFQDLLVKAGWPVASLA